MKKLSILLVSTASLMAAQGAIAESVTLKPVYATISPPYRTGDLHNFDGEEMVRVTKITATDKNGSKRVLFRDKAGAILPRSELENVSMLINPVWVDKEGDYNDLVVELTDEVVTLTDGRIMQTRMQPGPGRTVLPMKGSIHIGKYVVTSKGLQL